MCTEVFEHLTNPQNALRELARFSKPNGTMLITAPFRCLYHQEPYLFHSEFSKYCLQLYSKELNLTIQMMILNGNYIADIAREVLRTKSLGVAFQRVIPKTLATPYLAYLYVIDNLFKTRTPESCWGYHVVLTKGN
jgi:ubiquinone/menaquinone biosynthesis C-methylase UbiE